MQIIWLTTQYPSSPTDTKGSFIYRTVNELSKDFNIQVICLHSVSPPVIPMLKDLKNAISIYKVWRNKFPKNPSSPRDVKYKVLYAKYLKLPRKLFHSYEGWFGYRAIKKNLISFLDNQTIIHATWLFPAGDMANILFEKHKIPFVVTLMGSDVHFLKPNSKKWLKAKKIISNAKYVTSVSEALYNNLERKGIAVPFEKKRLTHTIYEFDKFIIKDKEITKNKLQIIDRKKIIFYAGTLRKIKNVDVLIKAVDKLIADDKQILLLIAGIGEEEGKLKELVKKNGLTKYIQFIGGLNGSEIVDYFNLSDVFCLPSKNEGLPNVIIESLLCGVPVVATSVGEIPYIISEGKNGYLSSPNNIEELSNNLNKALNQNWDRNLLRESVAFLSAENVKNEYKQLYNTF